MNILSRFIRSGITVLGCRKQFLRPDVSGVGYLLSSSGCSSTLVNPKKLSFLTCKRHISSSSSEGGIENTEDDDVLQYDKQLYSDVKQLYRYPDSGHRLLLVRPRVKHGKNYEPRENASLMMDEAVALVQTLPEWKVVHKCMVSVASTNSALIFGKGNLSMLKEYLSQSYGITGVFIGIDMLSALQCCSLQQYFGVPVFDRYQIVLKIFHDHAHTKEAKLQVALAEIPFLRVKLAIASQDFNFSSFPNVNRIGGAGETPMQLRRQLLNEREIKLKRSLERIKKQREFLRQNYHRSKYPIVAVVGYTNSGKTSLIKCLTGDADLIPEDKLFATLDVTLHAGILPSSQKVCFFDTVGFISEIPTTLIHSFEATLEDIVVSDLIIHVRDISHPHTEMQKAVVLETLKKLNLPEKLLNSIIEVGNKVDLLEDSECATDKDLILISSTEGTNLNELVDVLEQRLIENTDRDVHLFRVPNGGEAYRWLKKEAAIRDCIADPGDYNYLITEVLISDAKLGKFVNQFGDLTITLEELESR